MHNLQTPIVHDDIEVIVIGGLSCGPRAIDDLNYMFGAVRLPCSVCNPRTSRRIHKAICQYISRIAFVLISGNYKSKFVQGHVGRGMIGES
jgi:hypothetical protein